MRIILKVILIILAFCVTIILMTITGGILRFPIYKAFKSGVKSIWNYDPNNKSEGSNEIDNHQLDKSTL